MKRITSISLVLCLALFCFMACKKDADTPKAGTAKAVDKLIVVVEPGRRSIETAHNIEGLAQDIGLQNIVLVGSKVRSQSDKDFLVSTLPNFEFLGFIPYDAKIIEADQAGISVLDASQPVLVEAKKIYQTLLTSIKPSNMN